jgi:hypothetical protein
LRGNILLCFLNGVHIPYGNNKTHSLNALTSHKTNRDFSMICLDEEKVFDYDDDDDGQKFSKTKSVSHPHQTRITMPQ